MAEEDPQPALGVDLAQEPDFRLGGLLVSPSTASVRGATGEQRVEPRVMEVLVVLARHAGRTVTRDQLIDACWGGRAVSDDAVTRVVAQVRALARGQAPAPFTLQTLPKIGFRLIPAETADGAADRAGVASSEVAEGAAAAKPAGRRRAAIMAGAVLLVLALGAGLAWRLGNSGPARLPGQNGRVDVMVFEPRSPGPAPDPALQKIATDMSETLVQILSGAGVEVAQRPVRRDDAAGDAELRVTGALERQPGGYATEAQILDRKSGLVLWSDRLPLTQRELDASPAEVPHEIAAVLHCALEDRKPARTPVSTEAFGLYLNACAGVFVEAHASGRMLAVTRKLVKAAPQFAGAHAMHSIAAARASDDFDQPTAQTDALHAEAKAAALQALKIDPNTPKAYSGLALNEGILSGRMNQDRMAEEQYVLKALKLDPDLPPARNEYATFLRGTGRVKEAIEVMRSSDEKDPRGGGDTRVALLQAASGDLDGAEATLKVLEGSSRESMDGPRWTIAFWWEDPKVALGKMKTLLAVDAPKAQRDCFERYLTRLATMKPGTGRGLPDSCASMDYHWRLRMLAREGDVDAAIAALSPRMPGGTVPLWYPEMAVVRRDPRFWSFAKLVGLTDYWRKSGHWPDFCAEPNLPYDCRRMAAAARSPPTAAASAPPRSAGR